MSPRGSRAGAGRTVKPRAAAVALGLLAGIAATSLAPAARAQGAADDYARADSLRERTRGKVFRDRVRPEWIGETGQFWYRVQTGPDNHRFVLVDPGLAARRDAFDHGRLAAALTEGTGGDHDPDALPVDGLEFDTDGAGPVAFEFRSGGKRWRCTLPGYELAEVDGGGGAGGASSGVDVLGRLRRARTNGPETWVTFVNKTDSPVEIAWVDDPRSPLPYGTVAPGGSRRQHTFAGHVWAATDLESGKLLGVFAARREDGTAVVDGTWEPRPGRDGGGDDEDDEDDEDGSDRRRRPTTSESPDQAWRAEIADHNVAVTRLADGERFDLSTGGTADDPFLPRFFWSPDSSKLVVVQEAQAGERTVHVVESSPDDQLQPVLHAFGYNKPGDPLDRPRPRLFDLAGLRQVAVDDGLFDNPWSISRIRWSPGSDRFTFVYNQRGHQVLRLVAVDADTGEATAVIDETADTFVCYSSKFFLHHLDATGEVVWMSERDGWNHLYLIDATTGDVKNQITRGGWAVRGVERVDAEKREIWFTAGGVHPDQDPYHIHYCRAGLDEDGLTVLTEGDGDHRIEFSPDRRHFVDTYSRVDLPPVTELRRTSDGSLVCALEVADAAPLGETGWRAPERFVAKGRDGETDIYGVIFVPTNFDPARRYPVVEQVYAGPHDSHVPKRFAPLHGAQATAELGFVVVQIDGMGTSNRSKAFHDVCWQNLGDAGFPDRVAWVRAAARDRPWMDTSRVGIYGGSAGGQNAMRALISHGDFYDVAVADCGCHDNRMDKIWWNEQWMGYPVGDHYEASSNVVHAGEITGKLMLIVGELDRNVDPASTLQVADALVKADKDFDLVIIPGAGHGAAGTPYGRRRMRDFLVRHLLGVEPRR